MDAELNLTDSETESNVEVSRINAGSRDEGQAGPNPGEQNEGHAGPNPGTLDEGQAGSNPGDTLGSQPPPSHVENLKLPTEDQVILEEPASFTGTLSSLQNLDKDLSFTDQFFMEKLHEENSGKMNAETEVQSMVSVPIHQDTSSVPLMTTPQSTTDLILVHRIGELEQHIADLVQDNLALGERLDKHGTWLYNLENLDIPHKVSQAIDEIVTDAVDWAMQAPLRARFMDLPTVDIWEILQQRMFEDDSYKDNNVHKDLYEALQKSLESPLGSPPSQPPPPPPPAGASGAPGTSGTSGSSRLPPPLPPPSTGAQELSPLDDLMHDDSTPDEQVQVSDDQDSRNDHTPAAADSRKDWSKPLPEEERPATPGPAWTIPSSHKSDVENN
ncbi:hypothetical protein Tco_0917687 [Tanacetum coccineum]